MWGCLSAELTRWSEEPDPLRGQPAEDFAFINRPSLLLQTTTRRRHLNYRSITPRPQTASGGIGRYGDDVRQIMPRSGTFGKCAVCALAPGEPHPVNRSVRCISWYAVRLGSICSDTTIIVDRGMLLGVAKALPGCASGRCPCWRPHAVPLCFALARLFW